jgi:hypothetical protein
MRYDMLSNRDHLRFENQRYRFTSAYSVPAPSSFGTRNSNQIVYSRIFYLLVHLLIFIQLLIDT